MKKIRKIFIPILVLFIILFIVLLFSNIKRRIEDEKELQRIRKEFEKTVKYGMKAMTDEEYIESLINMLSDIEGMSQYDKYIMGLETEEGSDTDCDGLTDKEEIESYGSDPLKQSTAGDLYTDGYKNEHGMDLFTYYEYKEPIVFPYNECSEIILKATIPSDLHAVVEDVTEYSEELKGCNTIKAYEIHNYSGSLSIDVKELANGFDINISKIEILIVKGEKVSKAKYTKKDGIYTLKEEFDKDYEYGVYVVTNKGAFDVYVDELPF